MEVSEELKWCISCGLTEDYPNVNFSNNRQKCNYCRRLNMPIQYPKLPKDSDREIRRLYIRSEIRRYFEYQDY